MSNRIITNLSRFLLSLSLLAMANKKTLKNVDATTTDLKKETDKLRSLVDTSKLKMIGVDPELSRAISSSAPYLQIANKVHWLDKAIKNASNVVEIPRDDIDILKFSVNLIKDYFNNTAMSSSKMSLADKYTKMVSSGLAKAYAQEFVTKGQDTKELKRTIESASEELQDLVKSLTKKSGTVIPMDIQKNMKLTPDGATQLIRYKALKEEIKRFKNNLLFSIVSESPEPVDTVAKELGKYGIKDDFGFPTSKQGFKGKVGIDKAGKITLFTTGGRQLQSNIATGSKVEMNPKYDETLDNGYYCRYRAPNAVGDVLLYTVSFKAIKVEEKHTKTKTHAGDIGKWVKTWERDVLLKDPMRHVPAAVALLLYLTAGRVGSSKENRSLLGKEQTYGISTLRKSHVRISKSSLILDYTGKKGMKQKHVLKLDTKINKRIAVIVERLLQGKKANDLVFSFERPSSKAGAIQEVNPSFFRKYLTASGCPVNPHALRHIRGTAIVEKLIEEKPWKPSAKAKTLTARQREAEAYMKEKILTEAGKLLGHFSTKNGVQEVQWRTAIQSYVRPDVVADWFKSNGLGRPKWIPMKLEAD